VLVHTLLARPVVDAHFPRPVRKGQLQKLFFFINPSEGAIGDRCVVDLSQVIRQAGVVKEEDGGRIFVHDD